MRPKIASCVLLVLLFSYAVQAAGAPLDASTRDFDQLHLTVRVEPDLPAGTVEGTVTVSFRALADDLRTIRLHCLDTKVFSVTDGADRSLAFRLAEGVLAIDLFAPLKAGIEGRVTVKYRAGPPSTAPPDSSWTTSTSRAWTNYPPWRRSATSKRWPRGCNAPWTWKKRHGGPKAKTEARELSIT